MLQIRKKCSDYNVDKEQLISQVDALWIGNQPVQ